MATTAIPSAAEERTSPLKGVPDASEIIVPDAEVELAYSVLKLRKELAAHTRAIGVKKAPAGNNC